MYSWSGIGVPTTKAIIRESARLVNLTLGRAGFFYLLRRLYAEGDLWNRLASPRRRNTRYPEVKGRVVFALQISTLKPLTSDFLLFRLRRRNKKLAFPVPSSPPVYPKTAFFSVPNPLI